MVSIGGEGGERLMDRKKGFFYHTVTMKRYVGAKRILVSGEKNEWA